MTIEVMTFIISSLISRALTRSSTKYRITVNTNWFTTFTAMATESALLKTRQGQENCMHTDLPNCSAVDTLYANDKQDATMDLCFNFSIASGNSVAPKPKKEYTICRKCVEPLSATFLRIQNKINNDIAILHKRREKKRQAKDTTVSESAASSSVAHKIISEVKVELLNADGVSVSEQTNNMDAWKDNFIFVVNDCKYLVIRNPPLIQSLKLPSYIMADFPVHPLLKVESYGSNINYIFYWMLQKKDKEISSDWPDSNTEFQSVIEQFPDIKANTWAYVGDNNFYTPSTADIGCRLQVICVPKIDVKVGKSARAVTSDPIGAGPGPCPFEERHQMTSEVIGQNSSFRCVSYNILADTYANSQHAKEVLYPYCAPYALSGDYRKHLIMKELLGYNSDIICLQEVDKKVFVNHLSPIFSLNGFECKFNKKTSENATEGLATIYRKSKFVLLESEAVGLSNILQNNTDVQGLRQMVQSSPDLFKTIVERGDILQVSVFERVGEAEGGRQLLVVANTHLFWFPTARNVRLIQAAAAMSHIQSRVSHYQRPGAPTPALMFCGDFNSQPGEGVGVYMTTGCISKDWHEWGRDCSGKSGESLSCPGYDLLQPYQFTSACGQPAYTNYVGGFQAAIDWVYIHGLSVSQVVPLPSESEVTRHTALPSVLFPSDHLALVCDLAFQ